MKQYLEAPPAWQHDCELDTYLGQTTYNGAPVDLYFHDHTPFGPGLIARFSDEPSDNHTWSITQGMPPAELYWFVVAYNVSEQRNLWR